MYIGPETFNDFTNINLGVLDGAKVLLLCF